MHCVPKQLAACFEFTSKLNELHNSSHGNFAGIQPHVVKDPSRDRKSVKTNICLVPNS